MSKFWVVALETYKKHVKSVSFVMMVIAPFLMIGLSIGGAFLGSKFDQLNSVAIISEEHGLREGFIQQTKKEFDIDEAIKSEAQAEKALEADEIDGYLIIKQDKQQLYGEYVGTQSLGTTDAQTMTQALNQLQIGLNSEKLSLNEDQLGVLFSTATFNDKQVEFKDGKAVDNTDNKLVLTMVGFFVVLAMYMIVILYSSITAQEVASEKGTRIMEVILSSTTAATHFYGKIMGIFLVILTQVSIYLVTGIVGYLFAKDLDSVQAILNEVSLSDLLKGLLGYNLLFLLFGVLIYTILSAFMGSLVSKAEDAPKATAPVTYLIMLASLPSMMIGLSNPQSILIKVFSFVPFFSSFSMPLRIASHEATTMEVWLSLGLLVLSIVLLLRLSARVYKSTVLIYSDKSMMQVFKDAVRFSK